MPKIGFIDLLPSLHHTRITNYLSKQFQVESYFLGKGINEIQISDADVIFFGELDKTIDFIDDLNLPTIGISWARDIQRLIDKPNIGLSKKLLKLNLVVVDCMYHLQHLLKLGVDPNKIVKFTYGVDLSKYYFVQKSFPRSNFIIYSNRSWEPGYGHETLLEAFEKLSYISDTIKFRIAGEGTLKIELLNKYKSLIISGKLEVLGNLSEEENIKELQANDLYISASEFDGMSVSILESMAVGTPVVVTDIPPNLELIRDGENGFIFHKQKASHLLLKINEALESNMNLSRIAINSRNLVEQNANWDANMLNFTNLIISLLPKNNYKSERSLHE